ncbi:four-carbon acid sugar kinase family protein [Marinomonas transparens]|uniref:Four-carbon acid sugar kinase family protein n=1 Tax=Marinomonas transparens TaxID=2795388 RepID=A0A934JXP8_9GAMM|nr:four-carbon acid sugar kinase family protein [Marinomonas transparens]MBJ7539119.1 four-carbon acid sugar kinase family protein [Marinomonas transparens]
METNRELAFYGDDFTGSTDVLESLSLCGKKAVLWMRIPTEDELKRFSDYDCIGLAGISRSKDPQWMSENLPRIYQFLKSVNGKYIHYKVCSTFDSGLHKGNIAKATQIGIAELSPSWTSIVVGSPKIKRYVCFSELFADFEGSTYRIDRHPVMGNHPATPMHEANLLKHMQQLGGVECASVDLPMYSNGRASSQLESFIADKKVVVFDSYDEATHSAAGKLIRDFSQKGVHFSVSSSGFEDALYSDTKITNTTKIQATDKLLALSGSCSPTTSNQIQFAVDRGFVPFLLDLEKVCDSTLRPSYLKEVVDFCLALLAKNRSPLVYSSLGSPKEDQALLPSQCVNFDRVLGQFLGQVALQVVQEKAINRLAVAGGDTSGYCIQTLGLDAMTFIAPLYPGVPLCRAHSNDVSVDGLEIALKGGQMGATDFFVRLLTGVNNHG